MLRKDIIDKWSNAKYGALKSLLQQYAADSGGLDKELEEIEARLPAHLYISKMRVIERKVKGFLRKGTFDSAWELVAKIPRRPSNIHPDEKPATDDASVSVRSLKAEIPEQWIRSIESFVTEACRGDGSQLDEAESSLSKLASVPVDDERRTRVETRLRALIREAEIRCLEERAETAFSEKRWADVIDFCAELLEIDAANKKAVGLRETAEARDYVAKLSALMEKADKLLGAGDYSGAVQELNEPPARPASIPSEEAAGTTDAESRLENLTDRATESWVKHIEETVIGLCERSDGDLAKAESTLAKLARVPVAAERKDQLEKRLGALLTEAKVRQQYAQAETAEENAEWAQVIELCSSVLELNSAHDGARRLREKAILRKEVEDLCVEAIGAHEKGEFARCIEICEVIRKKQEGEQKLVADGFSGTVTELSALAQRKLDELTRHVAVISELRPKKKLTSAEQANLQAGADAALALNPAQQEAIDALNELKARRRKQHRASVAAVALSIAVVVLLAAGGVAELRKWISEHAIKTKPATPPNRLAAEALRASEVTPDAWVHALATDKAGKEAAFAVVASVAAETLRCILDNPSGWYDLSKYQDEPSLREKAFGGDQWAVRVLGILNANRYDGVVNKAAIVESLATAAELGVPAAMSCYAAIRSTSTVPAQSDGTMAWLKKAADMGYADAKYQLAKLIVDVSSQDAEKLFAVAVDQGHVEAMVSLGERHIARGTGTEYEKAALRLWKDARTLGSWKASALVGLTCEGRMSGKPKAQKIAQRTWAKVKAEGSPEVARFLSRAYRDGLMVPRDKVKSAEWLVEAHEREMRPR